MSLAGAAWVALTAVTAGPVEPADMRKAERHYNTGVQALVAGNYTKAREEFDKSLASAPGFPPALLGRGHVELAGKNFAEALRDYTAARDGYTAFGDTLQRFEMERYAKTQDEIRQLRDQQRELQNQARGPGSEEGQTTTQINLERTIEQRIQSLEAVQMPTTSGGNEPPGDVYFHIGNALFRLERYDEARVEWETCARKSEKFPLVRNNLAVVYLKAGRIDDARRAVAEAESLGMTVNPALKAEIERRAAARP